MLIDRWLGALGVFVVFMAVLVLGLVVRPCVRMRRHFPEARVVPRRYWTPPAVPEPGNPAAPPMRKIAFSLSFFGAGFLFFLVALFEPGRDWGAGSDGWELLGLMLSFGPFTALGIGVLLLRRR